MSATRQIKMFPYQNLCISTKISAYYRCTNILPVEKETFVKIPLVRWVVERFTKHVFRQSSEAVQCSDTGPELLPLIISHLCEINVIYHDPQDQL